MIKLQAIFNDLNVTIFPGNYIDEQIQFQFLES